MKRGAHEHPLFHRKPERFFVWSWLVANAAWKPTRHDVGGKIITVDRGQLCVTQSHISDCTGVGRQVVRKLLEDLETENAIVQNSANGTTKGKRLITICNYEKYQSAKTDDNQTDNQTTTKQQPIKEQENKLTSTLSEEADASNRIEVSVTSSAVWNAGKPFLASRGVSDPGSIIGRWLKSYAPLDILAAIEAAQKAGTQDPIPYITEALKGNSNAGKPSSKAKARFDAFIAGARTQ